MNRLKRLGIHLPIALLLTISVVVLRTIALFTQFLPSIGYYNDKLLISISGGILFGATLILLSFAFISQRINVRASFSGASTFIPSGIMAAALLFVAFEMINTVAKKPGELLSPQTFKDISNLLPLILSVLAIASVINFFTTVFYTKIENDKRALFGILTVLFLAFYTGYLYFDHKLPLNSPNKAVDQLAFLFSALFFLYETRISLGRAMWRAYAAFGLTAAMITAYSSIPTIIYYLASGDMVSDSLSGAVLTFTLFIYISVRVIKVDFLLADGKSKSAVIIEALSKARQEELALPESDNDTEEDEELGTIGENYEFDIPVDEAAARTDESDINNSISEDMKGQQ